MEQKNRKPYYLTTPIYYPSANLHLGNTYTTIVADTIKRYKTMQGYDVYLVTGSDEHGEKLAKAAADHGKTPLEYIDPIVESIQDLWDLLDIQVDTFVRSSSEQHEKNAQAVFQKLYDKGDIYKDVYKGYYCTPCESFWTESQLDDGKCPDCGREVHYREEESYFFRLSKYQDKLLAYYKEHPDFIKPDNREREMIGSFFKDGLEDLSVTRTNISWGVPVPFDEKHVIYVWIDALTCYLTGIGFGVDQEKFDKYWPAQLHLVGRDIVRFHTIIWPAILMALDMPLPKQVFAHGWILFDDDKMSKSKGNIVYPEPIVELYGKDALRYFILREFNFGTDGNYLTQKFLSRINTDLANDLGNLVSRTTAMVEKYNGGVVPAVDQTDTFDEELIAVQENAVSELERWMEELNFQNALESIWTLVRRTNKYIDETTPWVLAKEENKARLDTVMYRLVDSILTIGTLLTPFMPDTAASIAEHLGGVHYDWENAKHANQYPAGHAVVKGENLFQRLDLDVELKRFHEVNNALIAKRMGITMEELEARQKDEEKSKKENADKSKDAKAEKNATDNGKKSAGKEKADEEQVEEIEDVGIEAFEKIKLRVGEIIACEVHPDADRLLVETVDFGDEQRTIVSGLKEWYDPADLVGKKIAVVYNLKPRKIRGIVSHGMVLAAKSEDALSLLTPLNEVEKGAWLS